MRERATSVTIGLVVAALIAVVVSVLALAPGSPPDRVQGLAERLRCPVCTSVSVAESPSETAVEMRQVIADQVAAGRTDEEVVAYFRARYGAWAVIDPPAAGSTLALWVGPVAALVIAATVVLVWLSRRGGDPDEELSDDERARVAEALARHRATPPEPDR